MAVKQLKRRRRTPARAAVAVAALAPTRERSRHDRVTLVSEQIADSDGAIGTPYVVEGLLERLARVGDITRQEYQAGVEFRRLFSLGWLEPLRAASMDERIISGRDYLPFGNERARAAANRALDALGDGLQRDCAWFVVGLDESLRAFAWRKRCNQHVAKGVLLVTLQSLAAHMYGAPRR